MIPVFWHWLILGSALVALEAIVPGTFLLWPGLAAFITGMVAYMAPHWGWEIHALIFAVLTVATALLGRKLYAHLRHPVSSAPLLNQRGAQLIGTIHVLDGPITHGHGRLRLGDSTWTISGPDLDTGTRVEVTGLDGNCLMVKATPE